MKEFLESLDLPAIGEEQNRKLISSITKKELDAAISRLKLTKRQVVTDSPVSGIKHLGRN